MPCIIERRMFLIELDAGKPFDIADLSEKEWREIDKRSKQIIEAKQTSHEKVAFVAAFLSFISEKQVLDLPFGEQH